MAGTFDRPTAQIVATRRSRLLIRGLRSALFGAFIALFLSTSMGMPLWPTLVHSLCIATLCWIVIDLGRGPATRWAHRRTPMSDSQVAGNWPGWPLMSVLIVFGTVIGFSAGSELASWLLGQTNRHGYFRGNWLQSIALLAGSLVPAITITYWFYSREAIAAKEAAVLEAQRQAAEHQLKLLESQLEPHMLFNTLANLRVLIGIDPPRAQAMLDSLIAFLRATLGGSRVSRHPLSAEFARLGDYLCLMQIRMGDRLRTSFDLPADLADTPVPALLLQPLVENCIQHGLEPALAGGRIAIGATRDGAALVLSVRDTGVGLGRGAASAGTNFGLAQVRERLATLCGGKASLELAPANDAEGGTLATIRLPLEIAALGEPVARGATAAAAVRAAGADPLGLSTRKGAP